MALWFHLHYYGPLVSFALYGALISCWTCSIFFMHDLWRQRYFIFGARLCGWNKIFLFSLAQSSDWTTINLNIFSLWHNNDILEVCSFLILKHFSRWRNTVLSSRVLWFEAVTLLCIRCFLCCIEPLSLYTHTNHSPSTFIQCSCVVLRSLLDCSFCLGVFKTLSLCTQGV